MEMSSSVVPLSGHFITAIVRGSLIDSDGSTEDI